MGITQKRTPTGNDYTSDMYSDACRRLNQAPLTFQEANRLSSRGETPFGAACNQLIETGKVIAYYDHVLIDEGQDFPGGFYRLCFHLAKGERDRKSIVWAYDELQDIMNVKIRQPDELFGRDPDGNTHVDLDRSSIYLPPGATNDAVLSKALPKPTRYFSFRPCNGFRGVRYNRANA